MRTSVLLLAIGLVFGFLIPVTGFYFLTDRGAEIPSTEALIMYWIGMSNMMGISALAYNDFVLRRRRRDGA